MDIFINKIKEISKKNKKVAIFIDMDGTIVEYKIYSEDYMKNIKGIFLEAEPIKIVINKLEEINKIENIDIYILSLAKNTRILDEKKIWLKKNVKFIKPENWIILNKEENEYNKENRDIIKSIKIMEKLNSEYDYVILVDDDHNILRQSQKNIGTKGSVYHISSVII